MHLISHTSFKPYFCNHCDATFSYRATAQKHIKKKHPDEKVGTKYTPPAELLEYFERNTKEIILEEKYVQQQQ